LGKGACEHDVKNRIKAAWQNSDLMGVLCDAKISQGKSIQDSNETGCDVRSRAWTVKTGRVTGENRNENAVVDTWESC